MLVQHGKSTYMLEPEPAIKVLTRGEKQDATLTRNKPWLLKMRLTLGEDELRAILRLYLKEFLKNGSDDGTARRTKLLIPASAYISGL